MLRIPPQVMGLMERLECRGFQAWAVGGCVRDSLLGLPPHDWDLCTDALSEEMVRIFSDFLWCASGKGTVPLPSS